MLKKRNKINTIMFTGMLSITLVFSFLFSLFAVSNPRTAYGAESGSKNLLNFRDAETLDYNSDLIRDFGFVENGFYVEGDRSTVIYPSSKPFIIVIPIELDAETYTVSFNLSRLMLSGTVIDSSIVRFWITSTLNLDLPGNSIKDIVPLSIVFDFNQNNVNIARTFTLLESKEITLIFYVALSNQYNNTNDRLTFSNLQLEVGDTATAYEPWIPVPEPPPPPPPPPPPLSTGILQEIALGLVMFVPTFFGMLLNGFMYLFIDTTGGIITFNPLGHMAIAFVVVTLVVGFAPKIFGLIKIRWSKRKTPKPTQKSR